MELKDVLTEEKIKNMLENFGARNIVKIGHTLRSTCPLHSGDNPTAFVWNLENNLWSCKTGECGGGDIINFFAIKYDLRVREDFLKITTKISEVLQIDKTQFDVTKISRNMKELNDWLIFTNKKTLKERVNRPYDLRLLGTLFAVKEYRGYSGELMKESFYSKEMDRIGFKIRNEKGEVVGATLRRTSDANKNIPKWLHRPSGIDTSFLLWNLDKVKGRFDTVYVVEGIFDVLALRKHGYENVVATFGANMTTNQVELLMKYFIKIIITYDGDEAGKIATKKTIEKCKNLFDIRVIDFSDINKKDADELTKDEFDNLKRYRLIEYNNRIQQ